MEILKGYFKTIGVIILGLFGSMVIGFMLSVVVVAMLHIYMEMAR